MNAFKQLDEHDITTNTNITTRVTTTKLSTFGPRRQERSRSQVVGEAGLVSRVATVGFDDGRA